jgi:hypothetical protein
MFRGITGLMSKKQKDAKMHYKQRNGVYFSPYIANVTSVIIIIIIKYRSQLLRLCSIDDG